MKRIAQLSVLAIGAIGSCTTLQTEPSRPRADADVAVGPPRYQPMLIEVLPDLRELRVPGVALESMVARDASITDLLLTLFKDSNINLLVDEDVQTGTVTFDIKSSTVEELFEAMLHSLDLAYEWDGSFLRIRSRERRTFEVDLLSGTTGGGGGGASGGVSGGNQTDLWGDVELAMRSLAGDAGEVLVNRTAGTVHVEASPSRIARMAEFISTLERRATEQVSIEARILEVRLSDEFRLGVNWRLLPGVFNSSKTGLAEGGGIVSTTAAAGATAFTVGFLEDGDISLVVDALESMGQVRVLSSPRISTMNNVPANLSVIDRIPVIDREIIDSQGGLRTEFDIRFVDAGVTVAVTPQIGRDGMITVRVAPQVTEQTGTITTPDGLQTEPILSSRSASTVVRVADGQAVVIGGLRSTRKDEAVSGIPVLAQIPLLGQLFRSTVQTRTEVELMVILVPRRLDSSWMNEEVQRGAHRLVSLRRGFKINSIDLEGLRHEDWGGGALQGFPVAPMGPESRVVASPDGSAGAEALNSTISRTGLSARFVRRAQEALDGHRHAEAVAQLEQAISLNPQRVAPLVASGILLSRAGESGRAAAQLDRALAIEPDSPLALAARGALALLTGSARSGHRLLAEANAKLQTEWSANNVAAALLMLGEPAAARDVLRAATTLGSPPELFANLAFAEHLTGGHDAAIASLTQALAAGADPRNPRIHALQRILAAQQGERVDRE